MRLWLAAALDLSAPWDLGNLTGPAAEAFAARARSIRATVPRECSAAADCQVSGCVRPDEFTACAPGWQVCARGRAQSKCLGTGNRFVAANGARAACVLGLGWAGRRR